MRIERDAYVNRLIEHKHNGMVKVITGARRCGKSYVLFELFRQHLRDAGVPDDHVIAVALDDRQYKALRDPDACDAYVRARIQPGQCYVLIDEVQLMDEFEDVVSGFMHIENADVYITGSNSRFLSTDVITEFRGRGDELRIHPLTFAEYYGVRGGDWDDAYNEYLVYGGMPYACTLARAEDKMDYLQHLFRETYVRDIVERNSLQHESELETLMDIVASAVGSLTNPDKLSRSFRSVKNLSLSAPTIKRYLGFLEDAFLVHAVKRFDVKGKQYLSTPVKYYFEDVGVRNALLNFRQHEPTHLMENVIYNELIARGLAVDVGIVDMTHAGKRKRVEIDFVATRGSERFYIQSAFALADEAKRDQELRPLLATRDAFKKIVIVGGSAPVTRDEHGIVTMGIKQFLLDASSLDA